MKKFRILFTAAVCLTAATFLNSCDFSEFDLPVDNSGVAGLFRMSSYNIPTTVDYNADGTFSANLMSESDCFISNYIKLNSNHTYARTDNYIDLSSGVPTCADYVETGIWTRTDNTITLTSSESNGYLSYDTVLTYSGDNTLTAALTNVDYPGDDGSGNPTTLQGDVSYVFTRAEE